MYADLKIVLKIGKVKAEMKQTIGVRQGDCMEPVLFLFMNPLGTEYNWNRVLN